jgi:hypothetical protein
MQNPTRSTALGAVLAVLCGGPLHGQCLERTEGFEASPTRAPQAGDVASLQCWLRDSQSTSNQSTSLSDALRVSVCP